MKNRKYRGHNVPENPERLTISFESSDLDIVRNLAEASRELPGQWIRRIVGILVRDGKVELDVNFDEK